MSIKVAIIEDHVEFRKSIFYILQSTEGFICTGEFSSVEQALKELKEAEVILLDINLPGISGIEGINSLKELLPECRIIMLTVFDDNNNIFNAILKGADGYLLKKTAPIRILQAIEDAAEGGSPITPNIARQVLQFFKANSASTTKGSSNLSEREREILSLIVVGLNNSEISEKLFISLQTVRNHIRHIYEKLHVHTKTQAVLKALHDKLV